LPITKAMATFLSILAISRSTEPFPSICASLNQPIPSLTRPRPRNTEKEEPETDLGPDSENSEPEQRFPAPARGLRTTLFLAASKKPRLLLGSAKVSRNAAAAGKAS
jgi:hypothetical protein